MTSRRIQNLALMRPDEWRRQTTWDVPLGIANFTRAIKATAFIDVDETTDEIYDCTDEELLTEIVLGRFARLNLDIENVDADELAGWLALGYGVAAAPAGGANEVQRITVTATGGSGQLTLEVDYNYQETAALDFDSTAAEIQTALRALLNINGANVNVVVAAGGVDGAGPYDVTYVGTLANRRIPLLGVKSAFVGGTFVITEQTPGEGRTHAVDRLGQGLYLLPYTTFLLGHRSSTKQPTILKNTVVDRVECTSAARGKVNATVSLIGSGDLQQTVGYVIPVCEEITALRFEDTSLLVDGADLSDAASVWAAENQGIAPLRRWRYYYQNDVLTGNYAFTGKSIDVTRLHRASKRPSGIDYGSLGENGDTLYNLAAAKSKRPEILQVGPDHNNVKIRVPQALLRFDTQRLRYEGDGDAQESHISIASRPTKVKGDATTPSNVIATTNQTAAMLVAA